ncbi:OmpH family outer membrane protein [Sphingomonas sp. AOB5]|uniref:OmpH family outer membrane protein n=1 Tax=Sphingomonas sp. AOB5 TaxID=3034017 RepID=UPI0023F8CC2B|nr:OmpH family outer membrane protein [Sphingomonas sp. AOB5]MDF7773960.1 OmpH family outer membrane protein [Sphingomonas sp. AOB5]
MITKKLLIASLLAAPAALLTAAPAAAQVQGIASANPIIAIANSKAFGTASQQIATQHKAAIDQINARRDALDKELEPLYTLIDTNKDKEISEAEVNAAQAARNPALASIKTAQDKAQADILRLSTPVIRAQLYALEKILENYGTAQTNVINARKITVILQPSAFLYAPESASVTGAITAELDKVIPSVPIQPPANWNPSQTTVNMLEQISELESRRAASQQQQAPRPAGAAPAPAAGQPARPATQTPPPGR